MSYRNLRRQLARGIRLILKPIGRFELSVIYQLDLRQPLTPYTARIPVEISLAGDADVPEIVAMNPYLGHSVISGRMQAGAKCFLARIDGKIVGFNWIATDSVRDDEYLATLEPNEIYCLDARVLPEFRGNGIHTETLYSMLAYAKQNGFHRAYTRVSAMNRDSWKTHVRLGWREVGTTYFFWPHSQTEIPRLLTGSMVHPLQVARPVAIV